MIDTRETHRDPEKRTTTARIWRVAAPALLLLVVGVGGIGGCATTSQDPPDPPDADLSDATDTADTADAAEESRMIQYFVALLYAGPVREGSEEEIMRIQRGHRARIRELAESGQMVLAGPFGDGGDLRGLFIYDVATMEEAQALADADPAIQAGRLRAEIHPWWGARGLRDLEY